MVVMTGNKNAVEATRTLTLLATEMYKEPQTTGEPGASAPGDDLAPMTEAEFESLADLEGSIQDSWWTMGQSFAEIKAKKLYRQAKDGTRQTWEEYCKSVHNLTKQQVDKIIRAADVRRTLKTETKVSVFPETVSQASELSGLEPAEMATATENAVTTATAENRKPTAKDFKRATAKFKGKATKTQPTSNDGDSPKWTEYEGEVRLGFKLSVPEHVTAEVLKEAIRFAERWKVGVTTPFANELSELGVVVVHVQPWDNLDQFQPEVVPQAEAAE